MIRKLLTFAVFLLPLGLPAQSASSIATHQLWVQFDFTKPYTSTDAEQSSQMMHTIFHETQPGDYPHKAGTKIGSGFEVGVNASPRYSFGVGHSFANLGGATGERKYPRTTAGIAYSFIRSQWEMYSTWAIASWRPTRILRLGAGPGIYSVHETESRTEFERYGLHGEATIETPIIGPVFGSLAYRFDSPGVGTSVNGEENFRVNLNHSSLSVGFGLSLFK